MQWEVNTGSGFTDLSDGSVYSGSSTDTLTITGATATMSGYQYEAVFTNSVGSATTTAATLSVEHAAPTVSTNPSSQTVTAGGTANFTAAASGSPTPTVQWEVNTGSGYTDLTDGGVYSGSSTGTLTIAGATVAMTGYQYEAVFTNGVGTAATTTAATLTVQAAPVVTTNPTSQTVTAGNTATFTAAASGTPTPTVQWEVSTDGGTTFSDISGATSTTYSFTATATDAGNQYEAVFTNSVGSATTTAATLETTMGSISGVIDFDGTAFPGRVTLQLMDAGSSTAVSTVTSLSDGSYKFNDVAAGSYQIQFPQTDLATSTGTISVTLAAGQSSTNNDFTITGPQPTKISLRMFLASDVSTTQYLTGLLGETVQVAPTVTTNPASQSANAGTTATFTAAATGNPVPTVQWEVNTGSGFTKASDSSVYSGSSTGTLTILDATGAMSGYQYEAVFTNSVSSATTTAATLTVDSVTTQPVSQTINAGQNASFSVASSNPSGADTVKWEVNTGSGFTALSDGGVYSGTATRTLSITDATAGMNGYQYQALFTNASSIFSSSAATLTVQ